MHTKHKLKSILLMFFTILSSLAISNITYAAEPEIIALIYVSENCSDCDATIDAINSIIPDSLYIDIRNISESATETEYELIIEEYEITSTALPLLVTQNGGFTTKTKILNEIESLIGLLEETEEIETTQNEVPEENIDEDVEEELPAIGNNSEISEEIGQTQLQTVIPEEIIKPESSPFLALASLAIPVFMIWAAFYVIKKLNL